MLDLLINLQSLLTSVAPLPCRRAGGFASPPHGEFALIVCDNMHNVGNHYKLMNRKAESRHSLRAQIAHCVTLLWLKTSSKTC